MAMTAASASILPRPRPIPTPLTNPTALNWFRPSNYVLRLRRNAGMQVRCMADEDDLKKESTPATTPTPTPPPKVSTKFSEVFAFSGPAPERINGRLAMIGFVAAIAMELSNGQDVFDQISNGGILWFVGTSALLSLASLIPLFRGVSAQSESSGLMTSDAELWNGRLAMLGMVALAFTEYVKGGALVSG